MSGWGPCVIDATMGARGGMLVFCPVDLDENGEITTVISGAMFVGSPPSGAKVIAIVHEDGQEAVEAFYEAHRDLIEPFFSAAGDRRGEAGETRAAGLEPKDESAVPAEEQADAQTPGRGPLP